MAIKAIASLLLLATSASLPPCHAFSGASNRRPLKIAAPSSISTALAARNADITNYNVDEEQKVDARTRRSFMTAASAAFFAAVVAPNEANAAADCFADCLKNCKLIAPKDPSYCQGNCQEYCAQPDRTDGLSGSVSSEGGEMGILGSTTVVKGEDKPPSVKIPGLDFTSDKGRKLLGY